MRGFAVSAATRPAFSEPDIAKMQVGMTARKPLNPFVNGIEFQYLNPTASLFGPPPAETTKASVSDGTFMNAVIHTNQRKDYHKYPSEFDGAADNFYLTENGDSTDVNENDNDPKYSNPSGHRNIISPEAQNGVGCSELVGDCYAEGEPIRPSQCKSCCGINEFATPLHESRRERIHDSHLADGMSDRPDHGTRQTVPEEDTSWTSIDQRCPRTKPLQTVRKGEPG